MQKNLLSIACWLDHAMKYGEKGESIDKLHENVERNIPIFKNQITDGKDFKVEVITFNKKITREEKHRKVMSLSYIPVKGKVNLTNPELQMSLIEYYGISHNIPENPVKCFFGRWITDGQRDIINTFSLKKRRFIGTTSMDAELAFLMANMAQVGPGNVVFDPFVGTGSILVSAAQRGAYVLGCDIDFMTLHAKTKPTRFQEKERKEDESIRANLEQYGLGGKYLDILVMDSSRHLWRKAKFIEGESASAEELKRYEDFKRKFMQASQTLQSLSKEERKAIKKKFPMDKRGQGYSNNEDSRDILSMPVVNISSENCVQRKHEND
ncbi:tRNA (guanine(10)-N2)-methyltransferase-like protein [Armadillidium nasatum]|uniref:tRNA (Guanine(10)-N2)-methyltransferase-like protein n=1 Tax=Armadillidium nasatum TaxID=96803 RepID=A0A5N5SXA4_9CRUS|nr:tRNA (guanine(10)-N2)-methyltransferase-like protein [Armadillidium nasatum]